VSFVVILGVAGWFGYSYYSGGKHQLEELNQQLEARHRQVEELGQQLEARHREVATLTEAVKTKDRDIQRLERDIQRLQIANHLLTVNRRVAQIDVVSQTGSAKAGDLATKFTFQEIGADNRPLDEPRTFAVRGDVVYFDAWVVKYEDRLVESGDPLRSMSICLFRRIFGEAQEPRNGFVLDAVGSTPTAYRMGGTMTASERDLWSKFWDYANNPALAGKAGIRAAHGEAPSIKLMPGKRYRISLRASAGLEIVTEEAPGREAG
jgi:hypothetical protein